MPHSIITIGCNVALVIFIWVLIKLAAAAQLTGLSPKE